MYEAAKKDNITLNIVSATRTFGQQRWIWERKWTGARKVNNMNLSISIPDPVKRAREILKYSSMPGSSRHHWGTDIDIYSLTDSDFRTGKGKVIYKWLSENAEKFGYCQVYTVKDSLRPDGYNEEKWHWSYMPLAELYLKEYISQIRYEDIIGFKGCQSAKNVRLIEEYVLGVNKNCNIARIPHH